MTSKIALTKGEDLDFVFYSIKATLAYLVDDSAARKLHLTDMIQMTGGDSTAPGAETYPPLAPSRYTVAPGDTFASIAERMRTSASYATVIAQANGGMSADSVLEPGQVLVIPQLITMRNTADTHETAQHFMDTLLRNMTVHLNTPQPSSPSFLEEVVGVVIGVVAIMVAPYLAPVVEGLVGALEVGAIAAGIDAVGQVLATQLGLQSRFSATQALEVGLTAGVGNYFMPEGFGKLDWTEQLKICSKVAVTQQMGELALGMRSHLDLQGMIISAATATLNARLNLKLNGSIGRVGQTVTNAATGAALGGMLTGYVNLEQMAAQMLGSQIGSELGSELTEMMVNYVPWRTVGVDRLERFQTQQQAAMRHQTESMATDTTTSRSVAVRSPAAAISDDPRLAEARKWARVRLDGSVTLDTKDFRLAEYAGDRYFDGGRSAAAAVRTAGSVRSTGGTPFWRRAVDTLDWIGNHSELVAGINRTGANIVATANGAVNGGAKVLATAGNAGINWVREYAAEHVSGSFGFAAGFGLAGDVEFSFSPMGMTIFGGVGVGVGVKFSASGNYDLGNTSGFTSRMSANIPLGLEPVQAGASLMISQNGPAFSVGIQPGAGLEIESVVGYTKVIAWKEVETNVRNRFRY